jgi:CDP-diacylglycerol--glycerol-3-phosphate 3-phosphatidyltransferase/cardiolipin synthase
MARSDARAAGRYRLGDLVTIPGLLSLLRVPLAALFVLVLDRPCTALAVLAAAAISDYLDGAIARRFGQRSATGAAVDPITDKIFATTVAVALVLRDRLSVTQVVLLSAREIIELPLVVWLLVSHRARVRRMENATSNWPGKVATTLQFLAIGSALLGLSHTVLWVAATALTGAVSAVNYWRREWRVAAAAGAPPPGADAHG